MSNVITLPTKPPQRMTTLGIPQVEVELGSEPANLTAARVRKQITAANAVKPTYFNNNGMIARLAPSVHRQEVLAIDQLDNAAMVSEVDELVAFYKSAGQSIKYVGTPKSVTDSISGMADKTWLPPIRRMAETPFFDRHGSLISEDGYHQPSATYLQVPDGFALPRPVSRESSTRSGGLMGSLPWAAPS